MSALGMSASMMISIYDEECSEDESNVCIEEGLNFIILGKLS